AGGPPPYLPTEYPSLRATCPRRTTNRRALDSAGVEVRERLGRRVEAQERAQLVPALADDDVEHEQVAGPRGEVRAHLVVSGLVVAADLVAPIGVVGDPVALRDLPRTR